LLSWWGPYLWRLFIINSITVKKKNDQIMKNITLWDIGHIYFSSIWWHYCNKRLKYKHTEQNTVVYRVFIYNINSYTVLGNALQSTKFLLFLSKDIVIYKELNIKQLKLFADVKILSILFSYKSTSLISYHVS
jgi:hypothetical protein